MLVFQLSPHRGPRDYLQQVTLCTAIWPSQNTEAEHGLSLGKKQLITQRNLCPCQWSHIWRRLGSNECGLRRNILSGEAWCSPPPQECVCVVPPQTPLPTPIPQKTLLWGAGMLFKNPLLSQWQMSGVAPFFFWGSKGGWLQGRERCCKRTYCSRVFSFVSLSAYDQQTLCNVEVAAQVNASTTCYFDANNIKIRRDLRAEWFERGVYMAVKPNAAADFCLANYHSNTFFFYENAFEGLLKSFIAVLV